MIYEPIPSYKRCSCCKQEFPADSVHFHKNSGNTDKLSGYCKQCARLRTKNWARENPERRKAGRVKWAASEKKKEGDHSYYERECERIKARQRSYYRKNSLACSVTSKEWRRRNPEKYQQIERVKGLRRIARKKGLPADFSPADWRKCLAYWENRCAVCGRPAGLWHRLARDHWIPLTDPRANNPGDVATNVVPLCHGVGGCNNQKQALDPVDWLISKLGKRKAKKKLAEIEAYFDWVNRNRLTGH